LPWQLYNDFFKVLKGKEKPSVLIEVTGSEKLVKSLEYMKENGIYPFDI